MLKIPAQVFRLLTVREKRRFGLLMILVTGMAALDVAGVASIMPFLTVATNPGVIHTNAWVSKAYSMSGASGDKHFLILLGAVSLGILVLGNIYKMFTTWLLLRFIHMRTHSLAMRMLEGYLRQPYRFFLGRSSSDLGKNVLQETSTVVGGIITPVVEVASRAVVAAAIVIFLFLVDPMLAVSMMLLVGSTYAGIFALVRRKLGRLGEERTSSMRERFKASGEALQGIKAIKMTCKEAFFLDRFSKASKAFAEGMAYSQVVSQVPKFTMETIAFGGMLVIVLHTLVVNRQPAADLLPLTGLYAFAGFRLMPAMQQIFNGLSVMRYHQSALENLVEDLDKLGDAPSLAAGGQARLRFHESIQVEDVTFSYDRARDVLRGLSMAIPKNSIIGIAGTTGAGKTTLVDMLLGLLTPSRGRVLIDGVPLDEELLPAWRRSIGYVPQDLFLTDDTLANNIAFGMPKESVDMEAVLRAAKTANLHDFVTNELPDGYDTVVGERGIRLSGGQKQRIGIARALYHDPEVLVFDEATSALDGATEAAVMQSINSLARKKTIIMIAHRINTLSICDNIHYLKKGKSSTILHSDLNKMYHSNDGVAHDRSAQ